MAINEAPISAIRLQIKAMGYDLIPVRENKKGITGWPWMSNEEARVRRWGHPAIGVRTYGHDLFVLDLDVLIEAVRDQILAEYIAQWPEFMESCLRRHSGAVKIALIGRCNTAKQSLKTRFYFDGPEDKKGNRVETFGRNDKRLVVVQGQHSEGREYGYIGRAIWETPLTELPWFPDAGIYQAIDIAETVMKKHGLERRTCLPTRGEMTSAGVARAPSVYDLVPGQEVTLTDGEMIELVELEECYDAIKHIARTDGGRADRVTCFASLWDPTSTTPDRVSVLIGGTGLILHDFKTGISHRWKHCEPKPDTLGETLRELMKLMMAKAEAKAAAEAVQS